MFSAGDVIGNSRINAVPAGPGYALSLQTV